MTQVPLAADPANNAAKAGAGGGWLLPFVVALFFAWGFSTVMIDTLVPKLKGLFALNYAQAMLSQVFFFVAYFIVSVPASMVLARIGYLRGIVLGLVIMAVGCLLFSPAASAGVYGGFLGALFIMASGITLLQVAANPLIAILGDAKRSHFRLNLAQALNSLGTFLGPYVGASIILKNGVTPPDPATTPKDVMAAYRVTEAHAVQAPFLGIAAFLVVLAVIFWFFRKNPNVPSPERNATGLSSFGLLAQPRLALGVLAIFLYVGAEVSIGSLMTNYLVQPHVLGLTAEAAGKLVALYWGGAMVGRLIGSALLYLKVPATRLLSVCAVGTTALVILSSISSGQLAGYSLIAVGLFNSIMFPTIFSLAIEGAGRRTAEASGLLCMAIVGGAAVPFVTGVTADHIGLSLALLVPAVCYVFIFIYSLFAHGQKPAEDSMVAPF